MRDTAEEMKEIAREVRMETVLDLLALDPPDSGHKIRSVNNPDENVPSLHIYEYDFYDFSTGQGGDQIEFVKLVLNCNFWRALTFICQAEGMDGSRDEVAPKPLPDLTDRFNSEPAGSAMSRQNTRDRVAKKWPYLTLEDVESFGVKVGLHNLWVPFWHEGKVVGIKTRSTIGADSKMSIKGSRFTTALYSVVYRPAATHAWICEGESDTWCLTKALSHDERHVVYGLPAGAGAVQARWFNGWPYETTFLLLDDDPAGRKAASKIRTALEDFDVQGIFLPGGRLAEALAEGWVPPAVD